MLYLHVYVKSGDDCDNDDSDGDDVDNVGDEGDSDGDDDERAYLIFVNYQLWYTALAKSTLKNFARYSQFCVIYAKKHTGLKKVHHRRCWRCRLYAM